MSTKALTRGAPGGPTTPRARADERRHSRRGDRSGIRVGSIHPKAGAAILAGAIVTALFAVLQQHTSFDLEPAAVSSITTVVAFALMWFIPEGYWSRSAVLTQDD